MAGIDSSIVEINSVLSEVTSYFQLLCVFVALHKAQEFKESRTLHVSSPPGGSARSAPLRGKRLAFASGPPAKARGRKGPQPFLAEGQFGAVCVRVPLHLT